MFIDKTRMSYILLFFGAGLTIAFGYFIPFLDLSSVFSDYSSTPIFDIFKFLTVTTVFFVILLTIKIDQSIKKILICAFVLRLLALIAIGLFGVMPYAFDYGWDLQAEFILQQWQAGNFYTGFDASDNVKYYTLLVSFIYFLLGYNPFFMCLLNTLFGTLSVLYLYKTIKLTINDNRIACISSCILAIFPTHIMFSAMNMRDSLAILLLLLFLYHTISWFLNFRLYNFSFIIIFYILNFLIRSQNAVLILLISAPFFIYYIFKKTNRYLLPILTIVTSGALSAAISFIYSKGYSRYLSLDYIVAEMNYRAKGGGGYLEWINYSSWIDVLLYSPLKFIYFIFAPFLWEVGSVDQLLVSIEGLLLIYMTISIILYRKNIFYKIENKLVFWFFVAFCIMGLFTNSIIDGNYGTSMRHKLQYIYIFFFLFTLARFKKMDSEKHSTQA